MVGHCKNIKKYIFFVYIIKLNNSNTFSQRNSNDNSENSGNEQAKTIMKTIKKYCKNKLEINIEN